MSVSEWKKINLLGLSLFADGSQKLQQRIKGEITATCNSRAKKAIADENGSMHVFSEKWEAISFKATRTGEPIKLCALTGDGELLATIEQSEDNGKYDNCYLQIFHLNRMNKRDGAPIVGFGKLNAISAASALQIAIIGNSICVVVGFERGHILFYRGPNNLIDNRDISKNFRSITVTVRAITGIEFRQRNPNTCNMFLCSNSGIFCYTLLDNSISTDIADSKCVLDSANTTTPPTCCTFGIGEVNDLYFTVGCEDAIYCFTNDGRGPCYAIEGRKQHLAWYGNYLVIAVQSRTDESQLIVVDVPNKIIVLSLQIECLAAIIVERSNCYILTKSKKQVLLLSDRELQVKVKILLQKSFYGIALHLLRNADNSALCGEVNMQYGDYLLNRGNPQEAIEKYIQTIGAIQPFQIIRNLMDTRYNKYLAIYLRALAQTEYRTEDHLELLQSCLEREALPDKMKVIFQDSNATKNYNQFDGFLSQINDSKNACELLIALDNETKIYTFISEFWEKTGEAYTMQLILILKRLCTNSEYSIHLTERFASLIMLHDTSCAFEFLNYVIQNRNEDDDMTKMRTTLLNLSLREWSCGRKTTNEVLNVLEKNMSYLSIENSLLVCRHFAFWDGILLLSKNPKQKHTQRVCLRYLQQNVEFEKFHEIGKEYDSWNADIWLQMLHQPKDTVGDDDEKSSKMLSSIFSSMLRDPKKNNILEMLRTISTNQKLTVAHMKDFFKLINSRSNYSVESENQMKQIRRLENHLEQLKELLGKFSTNATEFRSSVCDMCKQQITFPIWHYLCQHSYHKECITAHSENQACIICNKMPESIEYKSREIVDISTLLEGSNDNLIENIGTFLRKGAFQSKNVDDRSKLNSNLSSGNPFLADEENTLISASPKVWPGRLSKDNSVINKKPTTQSSNPFETEDEVKEYDANLNPFAE